MKVRLPSPRKTSWYARETTRALGEIALSVLAAVLMVVAALDAYDPNRPAKLVAAVGAIVAITLVCANGFLRFLAARKKDREAGDLSDPKHLLGPLLVLHALVAKKKNIQDDDEGRKRFRVTLHSHLDVEGLHEQLLPYVGGRKLPDRDVVGRRWSTRCGIVGLVIRSQQIQRAPISDKVKDDASYEREMIALYGYTEAEARELQPLRMDALAIPIIGEDGQVIAVVYADSSERNFFDDEILDLCATITTAIAAHIQRTYAR